MLYVFLPPNWMRDEHPDMLPKQLKCSLEEALTYNVQGYGVYYYPNRLSEEAYTSLATKASGRKEFAQAHHIDTFDYVFVDFDLKSGAYTSKDAFIEALAPLPTPTFIVDSGNGIHAFWCVSDLDAMSFLKLSRRLCRKLNTDPAVCQIKQLMRAPGTVNTKNPNNPILCQTLYEYETKVYTCEQLDAMLPPLTQEDEQHCTQHFNKTYSVEDKTVKLNDKIPDKFSVLLSNNNEVREIWSGNVNDRSASDYRLGNIMHACNFTKDEALSVLVNCGKAVERAPIHRISYAETIVDKIWAQDDPMSGGLSLSVKDILNQSGEGLQGTRFPCWKYLDDTVKGFKLGHVIGLVGGSGVGKTSFALNMFEGFVKFNSHLEHFFISLEQPRVEIAERWKVMCGDNHKLHDKVHIIDNFSYDSEGEIVDYRDLSLETIKNYIIKFQTEQKRKVGCVVIDHIGVLANNDRMGQDEGVKKLCKQMKTFAVQTDTLLVMQSQTSREKAGIGDLELNKDAAFGTSTFENYTDFLVTLWQPLKRCYTDGAPMVCAYKFCKIRHKRPRDVIKEDERLSVIFDGDTERLRPLTQEEDESFSFFKSQAATLRGQDRKTEVVPYKSVKWSEQDELGACSNE